MQQSNQRPPGQREQKISPNSEYDPLDYEGRKIVQSDGEYVYYFDEFDVMRKTQIKLPDYQSQNVIRIQFLEKPYRYWQSLTFDTRNAIIPLFLGFSALFIIHRIGWFFTQREVGIQQRAKIPEEFNEQNLKKYVQLKQQFDLLNEYKEMAKSRQLTPLDMQKMNELTERLKNQNSII